jgi:hypothetical protein
MEGCRPGLLGVRRVAPPLSFQPNDELMLQQGVLLPKTVNPGFEHRLRNCGFLLKLLFFGGPLLRLALRSHSAGIHGRRQGDDCHQPQQIANAESHALILCQCLRCCAVARTNPLSTQKCDPIFMSENGQPVCRQWLQFGHEH